MTGCNGLKSDMTDDENQRNDHERDGGEDDFPTVIDRVFPREHEM
jgi:hypothetical protein